ncbi:hypothetical protein [Oceanobacillus massiliensis]|uniref:hypothetical protein n=1 Tax=Oceanobacillus massiliensis TaxID=1465765 RepID=UPI000289DFB8|nr:hypothetical protein [Oceanobacillus massiliensis]
MKTKIAVFGRRETVERVDRLAKDHENIEILPFIYEHSKETLPLIERAFMCDVYLFTEALSFLRVKDRIKKKKLPAVQAAFDPYMLLTSLYRLKNREKQPERLSIDVMTEECWMDISQELKLTDKQIHSYIIGDDEYPDIDRIVGYHKKLWDDGKIDHVLTSCPDVETQLHHYGIKVNCMVIPDMNIRETLKQAETLTIINQSKVTQLVTGYIRIKNSEKAADDEREEAEEAIYRMKELLTSFSQRNDAILTHKKDDQFVILGTKKLIDYLQNHYRDFPLLREIESAIQRPIDIGFGLGLTAKESEDNALLALDRCDKEVKSLSYIVNERKDTIGPIGIKRNIDTSNLFQALIHKAKLNNELSYNFIDFITDRNNEPFSSNDIATYYKVTKRSAERTVNKLLTGDVIKVSGEERPYLKGRPRKLFTLNQ